MMKCKFLESRSGTAEVWKDGVILGFVLDPRGLYPNAIIRFGSGLRSVSIYDVGFET